jgi:hypothetical protein
MLQLFVNAFAGALLRPSFDCLLNFLSFSFFNPVCFFYYVYLFINFITLIHFCVYLFFNIMIFLVSRTRFEISLCELFSEPYKVFVNIFAFFSFCLLFFSLFPKTYAFLLFNK